MGSFHIQRLLSCSDLTLNVDRISESVLTGEHFPSYALLEVSDRGCGGDSFQFDTVSEVAEIKVNGALLAVTHLN